MKKQKSLFILLLTFTLLCFAFAQQAHAAGGIAIDSTNFPDEAFRNYVRNNYDTDQDGSLSSEERAVSLPMTLGSKGIRSLKGLEYLPNAGILNCPCNELTELILPSMPRLNDFSCDDNPLTKLDVSQAADLRNLYCRNGQLTELDVTHNPLLCQLICQGNALTVLKLSNHEMSLLNCRENRILLLDLSKCARLRVTSWNKVQIETDGDKQYYLYQGTDMEGYSCSLQTDTDTLLFFGNKSGYEGNTVTFSSPFGKMYKGNKQLTLKSMRWQVSKDGGHTWTDLASTYSGYNTDTLKLKVKAERNGYLYRCLATYSSGVTRSGWVYGLKVKPKIITQPTAKSAYVGATASFTVEAAGAGLQYRWQVSKDAGQTWTNVSKQNDGYNTATLNLTVKDTWNGYRYRCHITDANKKTLNSAGVKLTVKPKITAQPAARSAYVGASARFSVTATGAGLKYRWQVSKDEGSTWKDVTSANEGYNTATLKLVVKDTWNGYYYRCVITDANNKVLNSTGVKLTVKPKITAQPTARSAAVGATARFTVTATGAGLKYRWQVSKDGGSTWTNVSNQNEGYNTATLKLVVKAAWNGYIYRCVITDANGKKLNSSGAKLTVK
nr:hypothetical protein [Lachnospiraceae bacterium]